MKKKKRRRHVSLVDLSLMLFMLIFLGQFAVRILLNPSVSSQANSIDIVIRTSASLIFGYFLSGNFIKSEQSASDETLPSDDSVPPIQTISPSENTDSLSLPQNKIGFSASSDSSISTNIELPLPPVSQKQIQHHCEAVQIIVVSAIGLISLILLLIARNFTLTPPDLSATLSQLRDFVSGCIGFLVGFGKNDKNNS